MRSCEIPTPYMLPNPVHLRGKGEVIDFDRARRMAKDQARSYYGDAMLLSWFDKKKGRYSPREVDCCREGQPSWVTYAKCRGGNITIDINHEEYVFVFRGKEGLS